MVAPFGTNVIRKPGPSGPGFNAARRREESPARESLQKTITTIRAVNGWQHQLRGRKLPNYCMCCVYTPLAASRWFREHIKPRA